MYQTLKTYGVYSLFYMCFNLANEYLLFDFAISVLYCCSIFDPGSPTSHLCVCQQETQEKEVKFVLQVEYWEDIKSGIKTVEMRSKTAYWEKRLKNATHCSFQRAYSSKVLPKKKIDAIKVVPAEDAVKFGGPKPDTPKFAALFRGSTEIFVVHFQPYSEEEVENIPDKKTKAALESLRQQENLKLDDVEVMDPAELFKPDSSREPYDPHKLSKLKGREIQFPANLLSSFIQAAWSHSTENEFMGWVTGKVEEKKQNKKETSKVVVANGLFLPLQSSSQWAVWEPGEGELPGQMLQFMEDSESIVVGWIHSHPTFDSFLSSVDRHTQFMLQRELELAFAIVIDKEKKPRVMRLTAEGMKTVAACTQDPGSFHEHPLEHDSMVVDIPYFVHHSGKNSKLAFFDQNNFQEPFGWKVFKAHFAFMLDLYNQIADI